MTREQLIEAMARAICADRGWDWDDGLWREQCESNATAALTALENAGYEIKKKQAEYGERDESLEAAITAAGRDKVFAYVRSFNWPSGTPIPKSLWWQAIHEVGGGKLAQNLALSALDADAQIKHLMGAK